MYVNLVQEFSSASLNFELFGLNTFENSKITLHRYIWQYIYCIKYYVV